VSQHYTKTHLHVDMREAAIHVGRFLEIAMNSEVNIHTFIRQPQQTEGLDGGQTDD
jgi:hypothetical protein